MAMSSNLRAVPLGQRISTFPFCDSVMRHVDMHVVHVHSCS